LRETNAKIMLVSLWLFCYPLTAQEIDFSGKWQLSHEKTSWPHPVVYDKIDFSQTSKGI
jgi:hypothetical protein